MCFTSPPIQCSPANDWTEMPVENVFLHKTSVHPKVVKRNMEENSPLPHDGSVAFQATSRNFCILILMPSLSGIKANLAVCMDTSARSGVSKYLVQWDKERSFGRSQAGGVVSHADAAEWSAVVTDTHYQVKKREIYIARDWVMEIYWP